MSDTTKLVEAATRMLERHDGCVRIGVWVQAEDLRAALAAIESAPIQSGSAEEVARKTYEDALDAAAGMFDALSPTPEPTPLSPESRAMLDRGIADVKAGRVHPYNPFPGERCGKPPTPGERTAARVRERCEARGMTIDRDVADAEGGRALIFFGAETLPGGSHRLLATIVCEDDGLAPTVLVEDRLQETGAEAWTADDIDESLDRIAAHLATPGEPKP